MKLLIVSNMAESLVNFRGPLIASVLAAGHEVVAVAPEAQDPAIDALAAMGARYVRVPLARTGLAPFADLRLLMGLIALIGRERPDAVLGYTVKPAVYAVIAAWVRRVPARVALVTGLGYAFGTGDTRQRTVGRVVRRLYRLAAACATAVVFQNPDDRDEFVARRLVARAKTRTVAGSGIDLERFAASPAPTDGPVFLLVARLIREKGVEVFADAARIVKGRHPDATFQVLGPFDRAPGAIDETTVQAWEREGSVTYLGETKDVRPYLAAASVFVLPSYYREGTPRTALEALATGRAVVTSDAPGCRETVEEGVNGYLVPPRDPVALAERLLRFVADPASITRMGAASRALACRRFDVRLVNADMREALGLGDAT